MERDLHLSPIIPTSPCPKGAGGTWLRSAYPRSVEKPPGDKLLRTVQGNPVMTKYTMLSNVFVWDHGGNRSTGHQTILFGDDMARDNAIFGTLHTVFFGALVYLTPSLSN